MPEQSNTVFVSYRREVSQYLAQALWQNLTARGIDVFYDLETIHAGQFESIIIAQIAARPYMVPVLQPGALNRCVEEGDWFRREIEAALERDRMLVPVYTPDFDFEDIGRYLPEATASALRGFNMLEIPPKYFRHAIQELAENYLTPISRDLTPLALEAQAAADDQASAIHELPAVTTATLTSGEFFSRGLDATERGDHDTAIDAYTQAITLNPTFAMAYFSRGNSHLHIGNYEEAISDYDEAIRLNPTHSEAINNRALAIEKARSGHADEGDDVEPELPGEERQSSRSAKRIALAVMGALAVLAIVVVLMAGDSTTLTTVEGTDAWVDTGVDLSAGDDVMIEATGEVSHGTSGNLYGPDGNPNPEVRGGNVPGLEGENHAALIGRIDEDGEPFFVGDSYSAVVNGGGRLFLGINDTGPENNGGEFDAVITVPRLG